MWTILAYITLAIYAIALTYITVYCLLQFHLLYYYKQFYRKHKSLPQGNINLGNDLPFVTIQLPVFNEMYVVERLIDHVATMDYPKEKFEIHVLDDSTDETLEISRRKVAEYKAKGFNIKLFHRQDRQGYKAGALKEAMPYANGEFIAIFDADFLPRQDFLFTTLPYFNQKNVGVVQTRWEHINRDFSILTRLQAMQLNVHFTIEQFGRQAGDCLLQFNGTAGVWRKQTIEDAGGWQADTLTEDLDLSYRAQLKGWKIVYLEKFGSPAELPSEMNGLKSQQFRWMKGGAENARKLLPTVWKSNLSLRQKLHATGHLLASGVFLFIFLAGVFSVPMMFFLPVISVDLGLFKYFLLATACIISAFYVANVQAELRQEPYFKKLLKFIVLFPLFLALSMGLSLHNSLAVIQGYIGRQSAFVRTPKFNVTSIRDTFRKQNYLAAKLPMTTIFEGLLSIYFLLAIIFGSYLPGNPFFIFHLLLMVGFGTICFYSVRHLKGDIRR